MKLFDWLLSTVAIFRYHVITLNRVVPFATLTHAMQITYP